ERYRVGTRDRKRRTGDRREEAGGIYEVGRQGVGELIGDIGIVSGLLARHDDVADVGFVDGAGAVLDGAGLRRIGRLRGDGDRVRVVIRDALGENEGTVRSNHQVIAGIVREHQPLVRAGEAGYGTTHRVLGADLTSDDCDGRCGDDQ